MEDEAAPGSRGDGRPGVLGQLHGHVSPINFSMNAGDARGVGACARIMPWRMSRSWTSSGSVIKQLPS
ncbi:hypothetical protein ACFVT6_15080 [Streptomyces sp. NPDC058049]|uniref:hypothetical protein n=1 Tax=Streptomyces sp. NPDC058049 TaxID=3346314 RepID=UPI0036F16D4A